MKLSDLKEHDDQLDEVLPAVGAAVGGMARGAAVVGSTAAKAIGGAVKSVAGQVGQAVSGLAGGGMDPAQAAQAAKDRQSQKQELQKQIQMTQQQLTDLRKKLAELG
jgi:hypothetical protein